MTVQTVFIIIILLIVVEFVLERLLSVLNMRASTQPIPEMLDGVYDDEKYRKQQNYFRENTRFEIISSTISFLISLSVILLGGFGWFDTLVRSWSDNSILDALIFFGLLFVANDLLAIPFEYYHTFVIETRFGFNKTTLKTFWIDKLKAFLLSLLLGCVILSLVVWIYQVSPNCFWLLAWSVVTLFGLIMGLFYSELIVPFFNRQTLLEAGELRDAIEKFSKKADFNLKNIYVIDSSKRSTKANAYFTGFGKKKRIVLYDTLMNELTKDEIVAVLAHEAGHNKRKHTLTNALLMLPYNLLVFYLLGQFLKSDVLAQALGGESASFQLNLLAFGFLYSPVSTLLNVLMNALSRKFEYQADNFVKANGLANELISALKKISSQALSNLTPHPLAVYFSYSHPTLLQRVRNLTND